MNRRKFLLASVLALQNSSFIYPSCQKCFSRIILASTRFHCPKCGSTGEAESASYRYKLSIKVEESNKLFSITVFGSCLDAFFGLTATDLHRYIQDSNEIPRTLDSDATLNLLTKAVETCFVGQTFIFGVKNFEKQRGLGSGPCNFLEQCLGGKRGVKALVACQVVLPDPGVAGFTVIDYFRQLLRLSDFRKCHGGSQTPDSHSLALEHSGGDLSSLCCLDSSSSSESGSRDDVLIFWQPSLELASIVSQLTDDDHFPASEQSQATDALPPNRQNISLVEAIGFSSHHGAAQCPWSFVSCMDRERTAQRLGEELALQAKQPSAVHSSPRDPGVTGSNVLPLKMPEHHKPSNTKSFHSAVEIKNRLVTCHQHHDVSTPPSLQEITMYCPPWSFRLEEIAGGSQDYDPKIWDDLPFSESLNKFLEVIENEISITQRDTSSGKHHLDNGIDKLHADHGSFSVTPQRTTGALRTTPVGLRSSQTAVTANSCKDNSLSNCEAYPNASVQEESQPQNASEAVYVSRNDRDISEHCLLNAYLSALFPSSEGLGITSTLGKSTRISPHRTTISLKHSASESDHCLSIKYFNEWGEKSPLEMSENLTALCSRRDNAVSDLCNSENKQYSRWPKNQGDSLTICRKLTYPLEALCGSPKRSTNTLKGMPYGHIDNNSTQNDFTGPECNYNASADLFDDSAKEMDITTEMTKKSQDVLLQWRKSLAESHHIESDFSLRSPENSRQPSQKLSLLNMSAFMYPKTHCSPHFPSDSESEFEDSQDFVPCSQSTPVAGFHQVRIRGVKGAFKKLPAFHSDLGANYRKTISSEKEVQQATPSYPKNIKTPSQKSRSPVVSDITQLEAFNNSPIAECLESDIDECVPPTTKKALFSDMLGFQAMGLRKCPTACNSPDQNMLPRKKLKQVKQRKRTNEHLTKKDLNLKNTLTAVVTNRETPHYNSTHSSWISKESVWGLGSRSEVTGCLSFSESWPPPVPATKSAWSPELFS